MRLLKRFLSCILIVAMLLPLGMTTKVQAEETDYYVNCVLGNYDEYLEEVIGYAWLTNDENYAYEKFAQNIKDSNKTEKILLRIAYGALGESLTIDDCITYLSTIMISMDNGMNASVEAQAKYNTTKGVSDYVEDGATLMADAIGLQDAVNTAKQVQDALGLAGNTLEFLQTNRDGYQAFFTAMEDYQNHKDFLTAIAENASHRQLKEAAKVMLAIRECQLAYDLELASQQMQAGGTYMIRSGGDIFMGEVLADWLKGKETPKFIKNLPKGFNTIDDLCTVSKKLYAVCKKIKVAIDVATFASDIFVGNEYRYLKEVMIMDDIAAALNREIKESNPENESNDSAKYKMVKVQVPLLEALCAVRIRGEYCWSLAADAKDTLFGYIMNKWKKQGKEEEAEAENYYNRMLDLLQNSYQLISEIFIVDDFVVSLVWKNETEQTLLENGDVFCNAKFSYPEVSYPSEIDADEAINEYLQNEVKKYRNGYLEEFGWEGPADSKLYGSENDFMLRSDEKLRTDGSVISTIFYTIYYYSGTTHPMHFLETYNFDTVSGTILTMEDILKDEEAYDKLCDLVYDVLINDEEYKDTTMEDIPSNAKGALQSYKKENKYYNVWSFTSEGLCIRFIPYQIAAYGRGYITPVIPYDRLSGIVKEEYLKAGTRSEKGLDVIAEISDRKGAENVVNNTYSCIGPGDGEYTIAFKSDKMVYDVMVYETDYVSEDYENVRVGNPIIALSTLSSTSIINIDCGASSIEQPNLVVTWIDGTGRNRMSLFGVDDTGEIIDIMIE